MDSVLFAKIYGFLLLIVILFQLALAMGFPLGHLAMGGKYPGQYPMKMRMVCIFVIALLSLWGATVFTRAGIIFPHWYAFSTKAVWAVVILNAVGTVLNIITPSKWERIVWAPVSLALFVCSSLVAFA